MMAEDENERPTRSKGKEESLAGNDPQSSKRTSDGGTLTNQMEGTAEQDPLTASQRERKIILTAPKACHDVSTISTTSSASETG